MRGENRSFSPDSPQAAAILFQRALAGGDLAALHRLMTPESYQTLRTLVLHRTMHPSMQEAQEGILVGFHFTRAHRVVRPLIKPGMDEAALEKAFHTALSIAGERINDGNAPQLAVKIHRTRLLDDGAASVTFCVALRRGTAVLGRLLLRSGGEGWQVALP